MYMVNIVKKAVLTILLLLFVDLLASAQQVLQHLPDVRFNGLYKVHKYASTDSSFNVSRSFDTTRTIEFNGTNVVYMTTRTGEAFGGVFGDGLRFVKLENDILFVSYGQDYSYNIWIPAGRYTFDGNNINFEYQQTMGSPTERYTLVRQ